MFGRILLVGSTATLLASCAAWQPFQRSDANEGYFPPKSVQAQDPYWARFYQLEQEIAQLKASNQKLQAQMQADEGASPESAPVVAQVSDQSAPAEAVLAKVRRKADHAIAAIDQAINALAQHTATPAPEVQTVAMAPAQTDKVEVAISGNLERDDSGQVVRQTTYSPAREHRYNFSVVYIYPASQPWNEMWDKLEAAHEEDKWRGINAERSSYFIYVGAYFRQMDAKERQDALFAAVGERPDLRERAQQNALASK